VARSKDIGSRADAQQALVDVDDGKMVGFLVEHKVERFDQRSIRRHGCQGLT
jgi:hypothetical protein